MDYIPCRDRTYPLHLSSVYGYHYSIYLTWLQQFVVRLGAGRAVALWESAFRHSDGELLDQILAEGWEDAGEDRAATVAGEIAESLEWLFPASIDGFGSAEAQGLLNSTPPFHQMLHLFPGLNLVRQTSTYETLHLFRHGVALLAEEAILRYGKEGELIVYDAMLEELQGTNRHTEVAAFMERRRVRFTAKPQVADMFSAGLQVEMVRASDTEVVTRVIECEWARYFRERHPAVGYLLACSLDNAAYRSFNDRIRLQRTTNLMEGGGYCDFRVYALDEAFGNQL